MPAYQLVIFDCDGVVVDSEPLAAAVACEMLAVYGLHLEIAEIMDRFNGRKVTEWVGGIEQELGRPIAAQFIPEFRRRSAEKFRSGLTPVPGIRHVLEKLSLPYCLASSGPMSKIDLTLSLTGMRQFFEGKIFSGYEVGSWKPDPDLFLYAAAAFDTAPADCVVIEDSQAGVEAGLAAGMTVLHYTRQKNAPVKTDKPLIPFHAMTQLPDLLAAGSVPHLTGR